MARPVREYSFSDALSVLTSFAENEDNLGLLLEQLKTRVGVVPFVGAGMSVPFGFPAWRSFLESQAPDETIRRSIGSMLDQGQYEEASEMLLKARGEDAFQTALEDTFGEHRLPKPLPSVAILHLPRLCLGPVLTTNFDPVLERVFENARRPFEDRILGMKVEALREAFHRSSRVLVKLHGDAADPSSRVLTQSDYERAYADQEPLKAVLRFAVQARPLLFLGCSLGNDRTVRVMEALAEELRKQKAEELLGHYAIVERPRNDTEFEARHRRLTALGIRPLWYPTGQHRLISDLLAYLANKAGRSPVCGAVPAEPPHYLLREVELTELRGMLLAGDGGPVAITGQGHALGVQGMGGVGKTVLAAALTRDAEMQKAYPDGIFWLTVGSKPNLLSLLNQLAGWLPDCGGPLSSETQAQTKLREALFGKRTLLVLDDVWNLDHGAALNVVSAPGRLLVTTRKREVLVGLDAEEFRVDVLSPGAALRMFAIWVGEPDAARLPPVAADVAHECGCLPLALAMIGAMIRLRPAAWADVLELLRSRDLEEFRRAFPDYPYPDLLRAIAVGVDDLPIEDRKRYLDLAVFPEDEVIPEGPLQVLWDLSPAKTRACMDRLVTRSLATRQEQGDRDALLLHDLQWKYARKVNEKTLVSLHEKLLRGYRKKCPDGWPSGPNDDYFFKHLCHHLHAAGLDRDIERLLMQFSWMKAKVQVTNVAALLADYENLRLPRESELSVLVSALRMAAPLIHSPADLAGQIYAHLITHQSVEIQQFLDGISVGSPWLRPLNLAMRQAGGPLLGIYRPNTGRIAAVAVLPEGPLVLSVSIDRVITLLDLDSGDEIGTCRDSPSLSPIEDYKHPKARIRVGEQYSGSYSGPIPSVIVPTNTDSVVCLFNDGSARVWRVKNPKVRNSTIAYEIDGVTAIATSADGRFLLTAEGKDLKIRDSSNGTMIRRLTDAGQNISLLVLMADGERGILVSNEDRGFYHGIRIFNMQTGKLDQDLPDGYSDSAPWVSWSSYGDADVGGRYILETDRSINALALAQDEKHLVAASRDGTLRVWDLRERKMIHTLSGHSGSVNAVVVIPNTTYALSASSDRTLKLWDIISGQQLRTFTGHSGEIYDIAVTPDGRRAISAEKDLLFVWDLDGSDEGHAFLTFQKRVIEHLKSSWLKCQYGESRSPKAKSEWNPSYSRKGEPNNVRSFAIRSDGQQTILIDQLPEGHDEVTQHGITHRNKEGHILRCELASGATNILNTVHDRIDVAAFTPDRRYVVYESADNMLKIVEIGATVGSIELYKHTSPVTAVVVTPDGQFAVFGSSDGKLMLLDLGLSKILSDHSREGAICVAAAAPDGKYAVRMFVDPELNNKRVDIQKKRLVEKYFDGLKKLAEKAFFGVKKFVDSGLLKDFDYEKAGLFDCYEKLEYLGRLKEYDLKAWALWDELEDSGPLKNFHYEKRDLIRYYMKLEDLGLLKNFDYEKADLGEDLVDSGPLKNFDYEKEKKKILDNLPEEYLPCGHRDAISAVAVTPDNKYAISASVDGDLKFWNLDSGKLLGVFRGHEGSVTDVCPTPDGKYVISASTDATLRLWGLEDRKAIFTLRDHVGPVNSVDVTPDGSHAVSAGADSTIKVWNLQERMVHQTLKGHLGAVSSVAVVAGGKHIISSGAVREGSYVLAWNIEPNNPRANLMWHFDSVTAVAITRDGLRAVSASTDKTLKVWDLKQGAPLHVLRGHRGKVLGVLITPDGLRVLSGSGGYKDNSMILWNLDDGNVVGRFPGHTSLFGSINAVAITPDGKRVVSASADETLKVWDTKDGREIYTLTGHSSYVNGVAVTPDGRFVISASADNTLKVWDLESGGEVRTLTGHAAYVNAVVAMPDGERAVSASADKTLKVWDLKCGRELLTLRGHSDYVNAVATIGANGYIVSASADRCLKLWSVDSKEEVASFAAEAGLLSCATAPDGKIMAGDEEGWLYVFQLVDEQLKIINFQESQQTDW